ncbi:hypothetical protein SB658_26760, partial [Bacillus sp. SIMBA_008]|uniref:hypothetical protein n=1 Tax=Bacillus sp. SIMBA_008 TaxID=3085757 RepID=UPI00397B59C3
GGAAAIGIAAGPVPLLQRYLDSELFDAVLCHNRYTLVDRSAEAIVANAKDRGMAVFNAAVFGGGILAAPRSGRTTYGYRPA